MEFCCNEITYKLLKFNIMKTLRKQIKIMTLFFILLFSLSIVAQKKETKISNLFVRVYNMVGKKINKGHIIFINDSLLAIRQSKKLVKIHLRDIGFIKTKRSAGNNILVGSGIGALTLGTLGATTADPDAWIFGYTAGEGFAAGIVGGGIGGAVIGGITVLFKKSNTYTIDGDLNKLKSFADAINI